MEQKTPLYDVHVAEGGKIVPFGGYLLPVQYPSGVIKEHMAANLPPGTKAEDISDSVAQLALQGPAAPAILGRLVSGDSLPKKYYTAVRDVDIHGMKCMVSRTGYTGELGYEIYTAPENAVALWKLLRETGAQDGLIPCGLGARDTLRLEAAMPLYGHEMDETISPLEAGLDFGVKLGKAEFIGRDALLAAGAPSRVRVGLEITGRGIAREHQDVFLGDKNIGMTTSGTHCPAAGKALAMALVDASHSAPGTNLDVDIRGRRVSATIVPLPFYHR